MTESSGLEAKKKKKANERNEMEGANEAKREGDTG